MMPNGTIMGLIINQSNGLYLLYQHQTIYWTSVDILAKRSSKTSHCISRKIFDIDDINVIKICTFKFVTLTKS